LWCFGTPSTSSYSNGINHTANGHYVETGLVASVSGALPIITFVGWSSGAVMQIDNVSVKASGGGTAYLKTLADSVILSDLRTLATQFHLILNLIENSLVLTDGIVRQPVYSRVIADNVTLSDLNTKIVSTGRTDSVAMGDSPSFILNIIGGKTLADNITLSDAGIRTISKVLSDSIVLTDAAYPVDLAILDLLLSEVLTLSDSITGKQFQRIFADSVALTEAMNQGGGLTNTDSITLSDNMLGKQIQKVFADSITVIDNQINDQVKIVNALIQDIYTVIDDNIMLELTRVTDGGRTIWINNTIQQFLVDSVSLTDDPGKEVSKVLDDVSIINDEIVWPHDYAQSVSDHIALHETIAATLTRFRSRCALVNILRGGLAFLHFTNTPLVTSINLGSYSSVTMPSPQEIGNNAVLSGTGLPNEGTNLDLGELRSQK